MKKPIEKEIGMQIIGTSIFIVVALVSIFVLVSLGGMALDWYDFHKQERLCEKMNAIAGDDHTYGLLLSYGEPKCTLVGIHAP